MSQQGDVGVIINGQTRHAWQENSRNLVYLKNGDTVTLVSGDVVELDPTQDKQMKRATSANQKYVLGVIPKIDDVSGNYQTQSIAAGAWGYVQLLGFISYVKTTGTVSRGDFLIPSSSTPGVAASTGSLPKAGSFGIAVTADGGLGYVAALLGPPALFIQQHSDLPDIGTKTHSQLDAHVDATTAVHGLGASRYVFGSRFQNYRFEMGEEPNRAAGDYAASFAVSFSSAPKVVGTPSLASATFGILSISTTGFTYRIGSSCGFLWIAIGPS